MKTPKKTYIYVLVDPFTEEIRYVGKTKNIKQRLRSHILNDSETNPRTEWILGCMRLGKKPSIKIIDIVDDKLAGKRERHWIEHCIIIGLSLTNTHHANQHRISQKHLPTGSEKEIELSMSIKNTQRMFCHLHHKKYLSEHPFLKCLSYS